MDIVNWVLSPGSRNAPITITMSNDDFFNCTTIVDERSAAFVGMGMAIQSKSCVALSCTSGSASVNYAPALTEAFYQKVPLLVVTSDRPQKWVGNGEGQSINQIDVFKNFVINSYHIDEFASDQFIIEILNRIAMDLTAELKGPVHLNLAFEEPLYGQVLENKIDTWFNKSNVRVQPKIDFKHFQQKWNSFNKIMILCGQMELDEKLAFQLKEINTDARVVILTETLSNQSDFGFVNCIDRTLSKVDAGEEFQPDLVITFGDALISKKIKSYLRNCQKMKHWHVSPSSDHVDVFEKLEEVIPISPHTFVRGLIQVIEINLESQFKNVWRKASFLAEENHDVFIKNAPWSDLKVFDLIHQTLPTNINLHIGNSSAIRYMQLFNPIVDIVNYGNRGVSGIDGSTSTAIGVASLSNKLNVLISGDLSFVYDINAFWNDIDKANFRVIVVNNGGGGIFRIIPGPDKTSQLKERFEVGNKASIRSLCEAHELKYLKVDNESLFMSQLNDFYDVSNEGVIMEIFTDSDVNPVVLKNYFEGISN